MLTFLRVRPDLAEAVLLPMFWVKVCFVGSLAVASLLAVLGLMSLGIGLGYIILPIAAFVFFRIYTVSQAAAAVKT